MNPWDQFTGVNAGYVYELLSGIARSELGRRIGAGAFRNVVAANRVNQPADGVDPADTTAAIATFNLAESIRRLDTSRRGSIPWASPIPSTIRRWIRSRTD